ncbi:MAG: phenylacetate--CoA ligase [Chitinophagales bacterium]
MITIKNQSNIENRIALKKLQDRRFKQLVDYMYTHQDFYKNGWDQANINVKSIDSVEAIEQFPFTYKDDLRNNYPLGLLACEKEEVVRIHCSSGSTGKPTMVAYNRNDIDIFTELVARSLICGGVRKGMRIHNSYGYGLFTGGLGIHYGGEHLEATVIPVSSGVTERQIMLLVDLQSEVLCCTPSYALTLMEALKQNDLIDKINLKYAILGAEPWTEASRKVIEENLNVNATNIYGLSEILGPGVAQEAYDEKGGSYIWEDHFYPEIIDPITKKQVPHGHEGVLVLTTLTKRAMPLMRYWTNDICSINYDDSFNRPFVKMSNIKGRNDDMIFINGVNVFPSQFESIIGKIDYLNYNYQLHISKNNHLDKLALNVESKETSLIQDGHLRNQKEAALNSILKNNFGINIKVNLVKKGSLPMSTGGKINRVKDDRNQ